MPKTVTRVLLAILALFVAYVGLRIAMYLYTDWLWFQELGYQAAFLTILKTRVWALVLFWGFFNLLAGGNIWAARTYGRHTRQMSLEVIVGDAEPVIPNRMKRRLRLWMGGVIGLGFFIGVAGVTVWTTALRYFNPVSFNQSDPIFNRDISFYIFSLPFYNFLQGWLLTAIVFTALLVVVSYYQDRSITNENGSWFTTPYVRAHLSAIGAGLALVLAWRYHLLTYDLLYSFRKAAFFGAGYTDVNAQLLCYRILLILSVVLAFVLAYNLHFKGWKLPGYGLLGYTGAIVLVSWLVPTVYEQLAVKPNELELEAPYIQHSITHTRKAYGLDRIQETDFPAKSELSLEDVRENSATLQGIPLWDRRPLMDTYSQLQEIRTYYRFGGIDADRYTINGEVRQVNLAAREFSHARLNLGSDTWVNRHLIYTHGYGLTMTPSNEVANEGLPVFFVKDIPPVSPAGIPLTRPEIYYGEEMRDYVVVRTTEEEFDYPRGDANVYTRYEGSGGVPINSFLRRLAFSLRFGDPYLLVSDYLTDESRILFDRHIGSRYANEMPRRFHKLAPFLRYDQDPYLTVVDGRMVWIQDAYTATNMYPYSEPYGRPYIREMNYIRNSVKATMDAYNGTVRFYVWDTEDPLIQSYMKIFPELFLPREDMPAAVRAHVRYPSDLFQMQSELYNTYHMTSPRVFYNREDTWDPAQEVYGTNENPRRVLPYYLMARPPGADKAEFVLMTPATPGGKSNLIAWLVAHCDEPNYGNIMVYKLPKERLFYGPMLIERRISQDTDVSREITLWDQRGSDVIRGNLLIIPIEESFIYVEPLYLRATQSGMPELKRVIAVHGERLAMEKNLDAALEKVFGGPVTTATSASQRQAAAGRPMPAPSILRAITKTAIDVLDAAQEKLKAGDFGAFGKSLQQLRQTLVRLDDEAGKTISD
jgi:hypothetical protein